MFLSVADFANRAKFALTSVSCLQQGLPTFLKLRATSCVGLPIHEKGFWFDTHFWNENFAQFAFKYFSIDIR